MSAPCPSRPSSSPVAAAPPIRPRVICAEILDAILTLCASVPPPPPPPKTSRLVDKEGGGVPVAKRPRFNAGYDTAAGTGFRSSMNVSGGSSAPPPPPPISKEVTRLRNTLDYVTKERDHWRAQCHAARDAVQAEATARLQLLEKLEDAQEELRARAEFCAGMGAELAEIIWTLTRSPGRALDADDGGEVREYQLERLLLLITGTVENFLGLRGASSGVDKSDLRLVRALLGCAVNVTASRKGLAVLAASDVRESFVDVVAQALQLTPATRGDRQLLRLSLMVAFNVSLHASLCADLRAREAATSALRRLIGRGASAAAGAAQRAALADKVVRSLRSDEREDDGDATIEATWKSKKIDETNCSEHMKNEE